METIASFKSHFGMFKSKKAKVRTAKKSGEEPAATDKPASTPTPSDSGAPAEKGAEDEKDTDVKKTQEIPERDVYFQGWVKYFRYHTMGEDKPKKFFKNNSYARQMLDTKSKDEKDNNGAMKIPSEKHFYIVIYKDKANFLTSREHALKTVADSMSFDLIKSIPEDNNFKGGIRDFGKFSEGSCFEVSTVKPRGYFQMSSQETHPNDGSNEEWLVCSEKDEDKKNLMNIIIKLKLKKQHSLGVYISTSKNKKDADNNEESANADGKPTLSALLSGESSNTAATINPEDAAKNDGYWIILQDWSQCTLKCGGGKSYLQLQCNPPKNGGKPCQGEAIRTKPCNDQPCPKTQSIKSLLPKNSNGGGQKESVEKPIVKMMAISSRPQRYDKCYLKDTDALMVKNDESTKDFDVLPKIPIRLVMNNKSVSVYQDESLQTNLMTFMLRNTQFSIINGDTRCFMLTSITNKAQFCQLDSSSGNFIDEWNYDFNLFKNQCKEKRETIDINSSEQKKLKEEYQNKLNQLQLDMVEKKSQQIKKDVSLKEEDKLEKDIEKTQSMTFMAVQKELKLEELLEKEEEQREAQEQAELKLQMESEKKKNNCLMKSIEEKEIENQMNQSKANAQDQIAKIKEEAKKEITFKRSQIKHKLEAMRKKSKRKAAQMQNDILNIRVETAKKVSTFAKEGNKQACFVKTDEEIATYCSANFSDSIQRFTDCKDKDNFCYVCCENEFGEMHMEERAACDKECGEPSMVITQIKDDK